jgi:hypothetical protein
MKIKSALVVTLLSAFCFVGCESSYTISELFDKEGCTGPCYKRMPCEGERITVEVTLNGSNVLQNGHMYFVRDEEDMNKTIKVEFDKAVPTEVQELMVTNVGKTVSVTGHIEGYDLLNPETCRRAHIIYVSNAEDIRFY